MFDTRVAQTIKLLKTLQKSTRQMQALCNHSKLVRDAQLATEAPGIKKALERLIFKVGCCTQADRGEEGRWWCDGIRSVDCSHHMLTSDT